MAVEMNVKAPHFELTSNKGDQVRLSEQLQKGPVVLAFFPLAFTGVCTEEMCEFRDSMADFSGLDAQVFGISVDSRFTLDVFATENNLDFPLLSDFNRTACKAYGVMYDEFIGLHGVAKRSVFVIGKDGVVKHRWVTDNAGEKPNLDEIRECLSGLA